MIKKYKDVFACSIGNALEWFDYTLYGIFASTLARQFFPPNDPVISQMLVYAVFALGFISRPIGGIVLGHIADNIGRRKALLISIFLMTIPTFALGLLPTYASIGIAAPILLVIIRLCQGIAIGGEFTGAMVYLVECSPAKKRGLYGSWSDFGSPFGVLLGLAIATVLTDRMTELEFEVYGWRLPFLFSILIGALGAYLRIKLQETESFENTKKKDTLPIITIIKNHKITTCSAAFLNAFGGVSFYLLLTFLHNYLKNKTSLSHHDAYIYTALANISMLVMIPLGGYLSDKFTRKTVLCWSILFGMAVAIPMFITLTHQEMEAHLILQILFAGIVGLFFGGRAAFYSEAFPTKIRCSAISLAFGLSHSLFAGTTPLMAEYILYKTADVTILAALVLIFGVCALVSLMQINDRTGKELQ